METSSAPGCRCCRVSAFKDLVSQAELLGVTKLTWVCDVRGWTRDERKPGRWTCRATVDAPIPVVYEGLGRTGEEAIRELVAFLEKTQ